MRVLVVDDNSTVRRVMSRILRALGLESVQAADGEEGLAALQREGSEIGLILADWNMPKMSGLELLKLLRADVAFRSIPFIMVTTETEIGQMVQALEAGANEYLMKPFTAEMLQAKMRMLKVERV